MYMLFKLRPTVNYEDIVWYPDELYEGVLTGKALIDVPDFPELHYEVTFHRVGDQITVVSSSEKIPAHIRIIGKLLRQTLLPNKWYQCGQTSHVEEYDFDNYKWVSKGHKHYVHGFVVETTTFDD